MSDIHMSGSSSPGQHSTADALPAQASAPQKEEDEEDEDEIAVKHMVSSPPPPFSGPPQPSNSQTVAILSPASLQTDDVVDISDDEPQNEKSSTKPAEAPPIAAPVFSSFPPAETRPPKIKEPLFLPEPSSSPRSVQSLHYADDGHPQPGDDLEINAPWDTPSMDVSMGQPLEPTKESKKRTEVYVLIPPPPDWVKRAKRSSNKIYSSQETVKQQMLNNAKHKPWVNEDEEVGDSEDDIHANPKGMSQREQGLDNGETDGTTSISFPRWARWFSLRKIILIEAEMRQQAGWWQNVL
jgi:hypothetical protein